MTRRPLDLPTVLIIKRLLRSGMSRREIARQAGVARATVDKFAHEKNIKDVPDDGTCSEPA